MDFPTDEPLPKTMSKIHGTMVFFGSVPNGIQPHLHICFSGKRWPASVLQSFPASFVLFWMQCLLKQSDYWQCESFSVNVFVCLRGLPTLLLQPTLVRAYLADRQAPPTRHYPPVRSRGAQPVSHPHIFVYSCLEVLKPSKLCALNLENTGWGTDLCPFGAKPWLCRRLEGGGGCSVKGLGRGVSLGPSTLITARSPSLTAGHHGNGWYVIPTTMPNLPPASLTIFPNQHMKFSLSFALSVSLLLLFTILHYCWPRTEWGCFDSS